MTDTLNKGRRDFLTVASVGGAVATLGVLGISPAMAAGVAAGRSEKPLKAAFSNAGLQATWCAQGKQAAEYWGKLFNVEVTWFDGQLDAVKQRAAIDNMASQKWDFVAIQAFGIGTLTQPVQKMIDAGMPVIDMDTLIAPLDKINVHSFLAPDNEFMGAAVTQALVTKIGGKGKIIMTQGALGHTGAQGRAKGFEVGRQALSQHRGARHPAGRLGRHQGGPDLGDLSHQVSADRRRLLPQRRHGARRLQRHEGAQPHQHPDRRRRRHAAGDRSGRRRPHVRDRAQSVLPHPWRRDRRRRGGGHGGEKTGAGIPKNIVTDGPVVTKANAAGMQWMEDHFLI